MAFDHREPDRVPVFEIHIDAVPAGEILGHFAPTGFGGLVMGKLRNEMLIAGRLDEFYRRDMETRLELCRKLDLDIIRSFPYPANPPVPELVGENTWRVEDRQGNWTVHKYVAQSDAYVEVDSNVRQDGMDALERLVTEMERGQPSLDGVSFSNMEWAKQAAPDLCVMGWADAAFYHNSWMSVLLEAMVARAELVDRWMEVNLRQILLQLEAQLQRGADLILGGQDFCDTHGPMFSPRHFERFIQPGLRAISAMCHKYDVPYLRHNDGRLGHTEMPFLLESGIDGWHAIEPGAGMDIFYFKEQYGDKLTLAGNIDCASTLIWGSAEEIRDEVRQRIQRCGPGGGYIVSSSNSIHAGVPGRNYMIMREAVEEYGQYPIGG